MAPWITPAYVVSGVMMVIGAYLTTRYHQYCLLKSPELEIAMELHRKKLMNEKMTAEEVEKNTLYKKNTQMNNYFSGIVLLASVVHIGLLIVSPIGETLIAGVITGLIIFGQATWLTGSANSVPYCIKFFGLGGHSKNDQLKSINAFMHNNTTEYSFLTHPTTES